MKITFYQPASIADGLLKYAVIVARYKDKWVFGRHKQRDTWEIPGGHREPGETIEQTALRELTASVANLATRQGILEGDVKEIKTDVKSLTGKSGKRWDAMVDRMVWAVLAALVAFVLGRMGL